jgi:glycosyltransferase involved in cell wall biosynthesis
VSVRVLYVIDSVATGGAERSLLEMAPHCSSNDVALEVAILRDVRGLRREFELSGTPVHVVPGGPSRLGWVTGIRRLAADRRPDLIHTTLFDADQAGRIAGRIEGIPVVSSIVNVSYGPEQRRAPQLRPWRLRGAQVLDAATAKTVRRFHSITGDIADTMARRLRIRRELIDVVPRGRDPRRLGRRTAARRARIRYELGVAPTERMVLAAARHEYQKGLDVLIHALPAILRAVPSTRLYIAGREGRATEALHDSIMRLGITSAVRFLGDRGDVPDLLSATDAFVVPARWEGLSCVVIEAMALEAPITASDLGPIREVLADPTMVELVPPEDSDALALGVVRTLEDPDGAAERAARARARFLDRFTIERITGEMARFYERALGRPSGVGSSAAGGAAGAR